MIVQLRPVDSTKTIIRVEITSYRDPDCRHTILDLLAKAESPDRVRIVVFHQFLPGDDSLDDLENHPQIVLKTISAAHALGIGWARSQTSAIDSDGDFILQIDSHSRMISAWDRELMRIWQNLGDPQAIVSSPPNDLSESQTTCSTFAWLQFERITPRAQLIYQNQLKTYLGAGPGPQKVPFLCPGFVFAPRSFRHQIPHDPQIYFDGEMFHQSLQAYQNKWKIHNPCRPLVYHNYHLPQTTPRHWQDHADWQQSQSTSAQYLSQWLAENRAHWAGFEQEFGLSLNVPITRDAPSDDNFSSFKTQISINDIFDHDELDRVIEIAKQSAAPGTISGDQANADIRRSKVSWLDRQAHQWIYDKIWTHVEAVNRLHFRFAIEDFERQMQLSCYSADELGFYDWHMDVGDRVNRRKLSLVLQLSDPSDYDGGDLQLFYNCGNFFAEKNRGSMIMFPSFIMHKVHPVTRGKRYSLVAWIVGPPWR